MSINVNNKKCAPKFLFFNEKKSEMEFSREGYKIRKTSIMRVRNLESSESF